MSKLILLSVYAGWGKQTRSGDSRGEQAPIETNGYLIFSFSYMQLQRLV